MHGTLASEPDAPPRHMIFEYGPIDADDPSKGLEVKKVLAAAPTLPECFSVYLANRTPEQPEAVSIAWLYDRPFPGFSSSDHFREVEELIG